MHPLTASDGFALMMLVVVLIALGVIASLCLCMRANVARRNRQVDDLIDEVSHDEQRRSRATRKDAASAQPWERDGDWWKK